MKSFYPFILLLMIVNLALGQNTFISNNSTANADFNNTANWTDTSGGGATPNFTNGLDNFIIDDGHNYQASANLNIKSLTIGQGGAGGTLVLPAGLAALDLEGTLIIDTGSTLSANDNQINIAGNWTENGSGALSSTGTVVFDAPLVQTISAAATFNHLTFSGGGVVTTGGNVTVNGNWLITNNTNFTTSDSHTLAGNLTIDNGSIYNATDGRLTLNGSADQSLNIGSNATFDQLYFNPVAAINYTITGNIVANDLTYVYPNATLNGSGDHQFNGLRQEGTVNFTGSITFTGGRAYDNNDDSFGLGTADIIISGNVYFSNYASPDATSVGGNLTVSSGYLVLEDGQVTGTAGATLLVNGGTGLYIRGSNNFPAGFGTITFADATARAHYDRRADQTIRGNITYGRLVVGAVSGTDTGSRIKTVDGPLTITGYLDLNNGVTFDLQTYDHLLHGYLYNNTGSTVTQSGGSFTFEVSDANIALQPAGTGGSYTFATLNITNTSPTAVRYFYLDAADVNVTNFSATNTGGSATNYLVVDFNTFKMNGTGTFTVGANVQLRTDGSSEFNTMMANFTEALDPQSTIRFGGTTQSIPGVTYGHVEFRGNGNKNATGDMTVLGNVTRIAETPVFVDGGFSHSVAGNWNMGTAYTNNMTGTVTFNGSDQLISASDFGNVTFAGSGTKTLNGDLFVGGDLTINDGITVDANIRAIDMLDGNWINSGTGVFTQTTGTVSFSSTASTQIINANANNVFGDLDIDNGAAQTVIAVSDVHVARDFDLVQNLGDFNLGSNTLYVGRNFYYRTGTSFTFTLPGATIHFNGSIDQDIRNYASGTYPNLVFSGPGEKRFYDNGLNIDGDVTINNTTVDGINLAHTVAGNWTNNGTYQHNNSITFDGADQTISASTFHDVIIAGSGTKTLSGNIALNGRLQINDGATLDVGAGNNKIVVEESWTNTGTGVFVPRNGLVEFSGGYSQIFTGTTTGPAAGKQFWDVLINTNTSRAELDGDLIVENDFTINSGGELELDGFDMYVAGNFTNNGTFDFNNNNSLLTFNGTSGTHTIDPGGSLFRYTVINAPGAIYQLAGELEFLDTNNNGVLLTVSNGTFDLNGNTVSFSTTDTQDIVVSGGVLEIDAGATFRLGRDSDVSITGGIFRLVGTAANPAVMVSRDPDTADYYTFNMTGGTIEAQYYSISNSTGNGLNITGGSIDATNNFSNGTFSNAVGNAYLTLDIPFTGTISNVIFNAGPTYNVSAPVDHGGALAATFQDALGALAGESYDDDTFNQINWTISGSGIAWDGGAGTTSWHDAANWTTDAVPTASDVVVLDHSVVSGAYSVDINAGDAVALKLVIDAGGANDITLTVRNTRTLDVQELLSINNGSLVQENTSTIRLAGSFSNAGTYTPNNNTLILDGTSGVHSLNTDGDPFYNLTVDASGAQYNLNNNITVNGDLNLLGGTFSVIGNKRIDLNGNWNASGGTFDPGTGQVRLTAGSGTQTIFGGLFYNLNPRGAADVQLTSNLVVQNDLTFQNTFTGTFDAGQYIVKVGDDWTNNATSTSFSQTGSGAVIFDGGGTQVIGGSASTTFNTLFFSGTATKIVSVSITVNGDMNVLAGLTRVELDPTVVVTGTATGTLSQTGGQLRIEGNNFPTTFGSYSLTGGEVFYYANTDQDIFATTYNDLRVGRVNAGNTPVKTLQGDITVNDDIVLNDTDVTLNANNFTINLFDGLFIPTGGQQINWGTAGGTGTLIHFGNYWSMDADITGFNNLILKGTSTKTMNNNLAITGDVTIEDGITLDMNGNTMTGTAGKSFTMLGTSRVITDNLADPEPAFPKNFGSYSLAVTSRVTLNGSGNQIIYTTPVYGRLDVNSNGNATLDGNLNVDGDFYMDDNATLVDGGFNMTFSGSIIDIRDYSPTVGTTVTLDGADQSLVDNDATNPDYLDFANLTFAGSGTKSLTGGQDHYRITGDLTVNSGVTVTLSRNMDFSGANFTNNGTFNHTANTLNFNGTGNQTIDPGADHSFQTTRFENPGGTKTIVNNGLNIDGGQLEVLNFATVDFGSLTHYLAITSGNFDGTETLVTNNASVVFDRLGNQTINFSGTFMDVTFAGSGTKYVIGSLDVDDVTINNGVTLSMSNDGGTTVGGVSVRGNWQNDGIFYDYTSTIAFESNDGTAKSIDNNGYDFYNVTFNQTSTNNRTYTLLGDVTIQEDLTMGSGAELVLNGFDLTLGNNDPGNPDAEFHTIAAGATLTVSPGSTLLFDATDNGSDDTNDADPTLSVSGTLNVVGASDNLVRIDRSAGGNRIDIDILSGGTINARYYEFSYLVNAGLDVQAGANVATSDPNNNFSDGTWSNMSTSNSGNYVYLNFEADATGLSNVNNVTFNHSGAPVIGVHYNVRRSASAGGTLTFAGTISGILAGETYEDDGDGTKIDWPVLPQTNWTGNVSSDWSDAGNWDNGVPDNTKDAIIGLRSNNPIINATSGDGNARSVIITDGILTLDNGNDLVLTTDLTIGQGSLSGILAVADPASTVFIAGGMTVGNSGIYIHGNGTLTFNAAGGTVSINPNNATLYNLNFTGAATYLINGATLDIDGSITASNGLVSFATNNYTANVGGDMLINAPGAFGTSTTGTVVLDGANQTIKDVTFSSLTVDGTLTKTLQGSVTVNNTLLVNSTLDAGTATLTMNGDVTIAASGTFDDGNGIHYFSGVNWTGTGAYTGNGTIVFNRSANQYIYASKFHTLDLGGTNNKYLYGDTDITGDLIFRNTVSGIRLETSLFTNTTGTGTLTAEPGTNIYVLGANNFPAGFGTYALDATSTTRYQGTSDQTIRGVQYGNLYLLNANTKTLGGNIDVNGYLRFNTATLDVSTNNYEIHLAGEWDNNNGGSFIARQGRVILDGSSSGYQEIRADLTGTKDFYDLVIDKTAGTARYLAYGIDVTIQNDLIIQNGSFRNEYTNRNLYVKGNLNCSGGIVETDGKFVLNKASGTGLLTANGSVFEDLVVNTGGTYLLQDDLEVNNLFTVSNGTFDANGKTVKLGNYLDVVTIAGTYIAGAGGRLELGNQVSLTVTSTGSIELVGSAGSPVVITRSSTGTYNFTVQGNIKARNYLFEYMGTGGIKIESTATIDATDNFSDGTFTNGPSGGVMLNIENTQNLTGNPGRIENVVFATNPGGGAYNVAKTTATSGTVEFFDATGTFAGADYENDPNNLIIWTGTETLTWTAGAGTTDWFTAGNWQSSLGGNKVPTATDLVVIDATPVLQPVITTDASAVAKQVTIDLGAILTLQTTADGAPDLDISGDINVNGFLITNSANDKIRVSGAWNRGSSGSFSESNSKVVFASSGGVDVINNGTSPFYDLTIESGNFQLGSNTTVSHDFTVNAGATFDLSGGNYDLEVGNNVANAGSFVARQGALRLTSTSGAGQTIDMGGSTLYDLVIDAAALTDYVMQADLTIQNDLSIISGYLSVNGQTLNMGDGGADILSISNEGKLRANGTSTVRMGNGASITMTGNAQFILVGTSAASPAVLQSQSGTFGFDITSGTLQARYYEIRNLNATGLYLRTNASLHSADNLSDGSFLDGTAGGRYLLLENDLSADVTINNVVFGSGPAVNARRLTGANNFIFNDASGALAGSAFEDDNPPNGDADGRIRWTYTSLNTWQGTVSSDWNTAGNWSTGNVPLSTNDVRIPSGTPFAPVISSGSTAVAKDLTIDAGASLTYNGAANTSDLVLSGSFINSGTFTHNSGNLDVTGNWNNNGTYTSASATQVRLIAPSGNITVQTGGDAFCNLIFDSDLGGDGTAVFQTADAILVNCNFEVTDGTLQVTDPTHSVTLNNTSGTNSFAVKATGTFIHGNSSVYLQTSGTGITLEASGSNLYDLVSSGSGTVTLASDINIENDITLGANTDASSYALDIKGNFANTASFTSGTGSVSFTSSSGQTISSTGGITFNNLTFNNTSASLPQIILNDPVTVTGTLTLTDGVINTTSTNLLHLNGGTLSGGSANSYVDGPMQITGTGNLTFPVGDGIYYARIGAESMTGSNGFVAQYFDAPAPNQGNITQANGPLNHVSGAEYWDLTRTSGTSDPLVRLYWEDGTRSDITDLTGNDLVVAHYTGGNWQSEGQGAVTGTVAAGTVISSSTLTSLSPITFGSAFGFNALPVELLSFEAQVVGRGVELTWKTASENNNDYFTLLRSKDGETFEELAQISGAGNSSEPVTYTFSDEQPYQGLNYYQLLQTDFDGNTTEAGLVLVRLPDNPLPLQIQTYPNPVQDEVRVVVAGLNALENVPVVVVDEFGRQYYQGKQQADDRGNLDFVIPDAGNWRSGIYVISMLSEKGSIRAKVVKM